MTLDVHQIRQQMRFFKLEKGIKMKMKTKFAGFGSLLILALVNFPAVAAPSAPCTKEIGEVVPDVGTYVKATADTNYFIKPGECLISPNKQHMAVLQPDGNFVVYEIHHIDSKSDLWNSGTRDNRKAGLLVQPDGRFVIYKKNGIKQGADGKFNGNLSRAIFVSTVRSAPSDYYLAIKNDGNLVLYRGTPPGVKMVPVWDSITYPAMRRYCVTLTQPNRGVVGMREVDTANPGAKAPYYLEQHNNMSLPSFRATSFSTERGNCP
jgi:hypothetical protein